ncbi:hypothetical protein [Henriciella litoralis]|uniref:hypothetical protein n=1 Tax=Henriciella litoralis TaxID=568102 RepID=UPI000A005B5D|nr:hypothetical protein [Henriciella litoralis]
MRIKPVVAFYLICAALYLVFSGWAEGLGSPRILVGLALPIAACHLLFAAFSSIYFVFRQRWPKLNNALANASSAGCFLLAFVASFSIDDIAISRTMVRGDQVVDNVRAYHKLNGICPEALTDIYPDPRDAPSPALILSEFYLHDCDVRFSSTLFTTCKRSIDSEVWTCAD